MLVDDGELFDKHGHLLIGKPPKPAEHKQLPVIPPHSDILDGFVDELRSHCGGLVSIRWTWHIHKIGNLR